MLVNRLQDHVLGKVKLETTQVTAALGLLKKTLPDLQAAEVKHSGAIDTGGVDIPRRPETREEWLARRDLDLSALGAAAGSAARRH